MDTMTAYAVLGLRYGASKEEIRTAYRELCKELHPDNPGTTEADHEKYLKVAEAYSVLENVYPIGGDREKPQKSGYDVYKRSARVMGTSVVSHPGSSGYQAEQRRFEARMQKAREEKKIQLNEELKLRSEKLQEKIAKERAILNEIRMIRLAHIIHETIAADKKYGGESNND